MSILSDYLNVTTDSSQILTARYGDTAGIAITVDTGLSVSIGTEIMPYYRIIIPEIIYPSPSPYKELLQFNESEISRLMHPDSMANPVLADIWRDEVNDEFISS